MRNSGRIGKVKEGIELVFFMKSIILSRLIILVVVIDTNISTNIKLTLDKLIPKNKNML